MVTCLPRSRTSLDPLPCLLFHDIEASQSWIGMDVEEREILALQQQFIAGQDKPSATSRRREQTSFPGNASSDFVAGNRINLSIDDAHEQLARSQDHKSPGIIQDIVEHDINDFVEAEFRRDNTNLRPKKIDWKAKNSTSGGTGSSRFRSTRRFNDNVVEQRTRTSAVPLDNQIDEENQKVLNNMADEEILAEKKRLTDTLDPAILNALLKRHKRTTTSIQSGPDDFGPKFTSESITAIPRVASHPPVLGNSPKDQAIPPASTNTADRDRYTSGEESLQQGSDDHIHDATCLPPDAHHVHYPSSSSVSADVDPNSATFLQDLKSKYFPDLNHDPSSLAWMQAPTAAEESEYHESLDSLMPSQLRFDFFGNFLAPRTSREVDADIGLHHHSDAPRAAGYTIPELARLCRSSYSSQACIAIQTMGRIMYKLGKQFYGQSISQKLNRLIQKLEVEATLLERVRDRHMSVSSYATEALWQANLGRQGQTLEGL